MASPPRVPSASRKRKNGPDMNAEDGGFSPPKKAAKLDVTGEITHDFDHQEVVYTPKKISKVAKEVKKLHRERVVEAMKSVCYGCIQIIAHLAAEERKPMQVIPLLGDLVLSLLIPIEDMMVTLEMTELGREGEIMRRKAVGSVNAGFFMMAIPDVSANELMQNEMLEGWLQSSFTDFTTKYQQEAALETRELFMLTLERAISPNTTFDILIPNGISSLGSLSSTTSSASIIEPIGDACVGISSASILTGFRSFQAAFRHNQDVVLEEMVLPDNTTLSVLRSTECEKVRRRGNMCSQCRAAQNRWAVRICRHKKSISSPSPLKLDPM